MTKTYKYLFLYLKTIYDIGLLRINRRFIFDVRNFLDRFYYRYFIKKYSKSKHLQFWDYLDLEFGNSIKNYSVKDKSIIEKVDLDILNMKITLIEPINWNKVCKKRLATFNLHYFDWAKIIILDSFKTKKHNSNSQKKLIYLIDSWIKFNSTNFGDGWHPYTISLRIRNWIWIFRLFPELVNENRIKYLWIQMNWLNEHQEIHLGGNHYLENLISLVISSLQFNSLLSEVIYKKSIFKLENELNKQILNDGGHQERSSSYHLSLLSTLAELACFLQIKKGIRPTWIIEKLNIMTEWSEKIILYDSKYPRFNDSIFDEKININQIINFSQSYLNQINLLEDEFNLQNILIKKICKNKKSEKSIVKPFLLTRNFKRAHIEKLPNTGWIIFRPSDDWEITFKGGISGPKHLHGHAHSDLLTFDIFKNSKPIIAETGTSEYEFSSIRKYERSSISHNVMQFTNQKNINLDSFLNWSESVEVWGSFRAARKPKILSLSCGLDNNKFLWGECTYKPFQSYLLLHQRTLKMKVSNKNELLFFVNDKVVSNRNIYWRSNIHLGPYQKRSLLSNLYASDNSEILFYKWYKSWTSNQFYKRVPSESLILFGKFKRGENLKNTKIILK